MLKANSNVNFNSLKNLEDTELLKAILCFIMAFRSRNEHNTKKLYAFGCVLYKELLPKVKPYIALEIDAMFEFLYRSTEISETIGTRGMSGALYFSQIKFLDSIFSRNESLRLKIDEISNQENFVKKGYEKFINNKKSEEFAEKISKGVEKIENFEDKKNFLRRELLGYSSAIILSNETLGAIADLCIKDYSWISALEGAIKETNPNFPVGVTNDELLLRLVRFIERELMNDEKALRVARKIRNENKYGVFAEKLETKKRIAA